MSKRRVAILISGRGSNMAALIDAAKARDFPARIALVASNIAGAGGLTKAQAEGIETITVESKPFGKDRESFERAMNAELETHKIEIVCLAGFLRLLTPWFVKRWEGRMINIHPALLPAYRGLHTHERAIADGVKIHGATVHYVVPDVDAGPVIAQGAVAVHPDDTPDTLAARVLGVEHLIYPQALRMVASGQVAFDGKTFSSSGTVAPDTALISPSL
ncbi:MAG: phosphoribosylglycinamide formyltransferase [Xanthobacteraceae bacterium]|nr:phosphoribosylglycinamide formyltransferase [Xanthobacteraceae bacterium]